MSIVTLTSDFGWQDYYLAMIKGAILKKDPTVNIIDLSHGVKNYDIVQAAFIFKNAWTSFPKGTVHLISVNDYNRVKKRFLAATYQGHYFIAPDNGVFSLIFDEHGPSVFHELSYEEDSPFPLKDVYANAINYLCKARPIIELGPATEDIEQRITLQPVTSHAQIRGSVIYLDNFENAITNVSRDLFDRVGGGRSFKLFFRRHDPILKLSTHYYNVTVGEPLCLFNSANYLEIAINMGKAASLLGLKVEDTIQIDFHT